MVVRHALPPRTLHLALSTLHLAPRTLLLAFSPATVHPRVMAVSTTSTCPHLLAHLVEVCTPLDGHITLVDQVDNPNTILFTSSILFTILVISIIIPIVNIRLLTPEGSK